jgi:crotonobetainyl-CoA:carnitine CoA-transferase CaiB-like acyl-CoA transferase
MTDESRPGARLLAGYRILDLADEAGAYCTLTLANLGAEVIKVEPPAGCSSRRLPPFSRDEPGPESSLFHLYYHAGKRSVTLDLDTPGGQAHCRRLAATADALVETAPPGLMARRGLDYASLSAINPGLVYTSLTGFGQTGPRRDWLCPEPVLLAMGGVLYQCGEPGEEPCAPPGHFAYGVASSFATLGTLVALFARGASGRGQHVDVAAQECVALITDSSIPKYARTGVVPGREGAAYGFITPGGLYPCQDGYVRIVSAQLRHWRAMLRWMGDPAPFADPAWEARDLRNRERARLDDAIATFTRRFTRAELFEQGQDAGVPVTPVNTPAEFVESAFVAERGYFHPLTHPLVGTYRAPGAGFHLDGAPVPAAGPAPLLGQHNAAIYGELDLPADDPGLPADAPRRPAAILGTQEPVGAGFTRGPLTGVRVLEFGTGYVGPVIGMRLGDFGADVVKIETGRAIDFMRGPAPRGTDLSPSWYDVNRNKRGVTIDAATPAGKALVLRLVERADVVVENFGAGVLRRLRLDYEALRAVRPDLVMLSSQGLGATARRSLTLGQNLPPLIGLTYLWNHPGAAEPVGTHLFHPDYFGGVQGACLVLAMLDHRRRTGAGHYVDVSQAELAASLMGQYYLDWTVNGRVTEPQGNHAYPGAPVDCYRCAGEDAWCVIVVRTEAEWAAFCRAIGDPAWARDPHFADLAARVRHRAALDAHVTAWTRERTPHAAMETLQAAGVPAGAVQTAADLLVDPQLAAHEFIVTLDALPPEPIPAGGIPVRLSDTPGAVHRPPPLFGEHTAEVLHDWLGLTPDDVARLAADGALQ